MSILNLPIPDRPGYFGPHGTPPGVVDETDAYETLDDGSEWLASRPVISPRLIVVHTNAARREGTVQASINWGQSDRNRTKPHYCVNQPMPAKTLATDRRGIGNSTGSELESLFGERDVSYWSIVIETADMGTDAAAAAGYPAGDLGPFLEESVYGPIRVPHAEIVARILAYESIVWSIPLVVPEVWNGTGVATHTWPYPYPHYTTVPGKTCPGQTKIDQFQSEILPRAVAIRDAWAEPTEGPPMLTVPTPEPTLVRIDGYDEVVLIDAGEVVPVTRQLAELHGWDVDAAIRSPHPDHATLRRWIESRLGGPLTVSGGG